MRVMYNLTGERRKQLVTAVSEAVGIPPRYRGAPSFAFEVGCYEIDRQGALIAPAGHDMDAWERLLAQLYMKGFLYEGREDDPLPEPAAVQAPALESCAPAPVGEPITADGFTIELPLAGFTDAQLLNLERLVASKATLLKKALGAHTLVITKTEDKLQFPWFDRVLNADEAWAYAMLITAMADMAKRQKRINTTQKTVDSERFAFRVFLLRLGFCGLEHAAERKLLLRNLSGPSGFPSAAKARDHAAKWADLRRRRRVDPYDPVEQVLKSYRAMSVAEKDAWSLATAHEWVEAKRRFELDQGLEPYAYDAQAVYNFIRELVWQSQRRGANDNLG